MKEDCEALYQMLAKIKCFNLKGLKCTWQQGGHADLRKEVDAMQEIQLGVRYGFLGKCEAHWGKPPA
eukprot:CAMPEP_0172027904 /NCGR_PEP_ID=MMETSP1041-20130122/17259_1 /TAXON_ID=464988 /ORGANISM="Hemiselmis andersenii, Strain CCMP439" /LENGTH=66 /DNA_ID=CAMNT_0012683857 /DNA_START=9 /DNA_END=209 /DNA_ORIENTATION=-